MDYNLHFHFLRRTIQSQLKEFSIRKKMEKKRDTSVSKDKRKERKYLFYKARLIHFVKGLKT